MNPSPGTMVGSAVEPFVHIKGICGIRMYGTRKCRHKLRVRGVMNRFVPDSAVVPAGIETEDFRVRMLTVSDVVKDYDAVMSSIDHIRSVMGPNTSWPSVDLTLEQNLIDLGWHQKEFQIRSSFAYTVMSLDEKRCLGCVYVDPATKEGYDAEVTLWARQSELKNNLDEKLFVAVRKWLADEWWFTRVAFPGRELSLREWEALPNKRPA